MTKPEVTIPDTPPPADLVIEDLVVGDGPEATPGQPVEVHYVGVAWSTGREFDASWDRGGSFGFRLGAGQVITGWDEGVAGMKLGGRRRLTIPPASTGVALIMLRAVDLAAALLVGLFERPETLHSQRFKLIASFFPIRPAS